MNNRTIFEAMERFEKGIKLLAYWGWRALPVVEDAVRRKDQHPEGGVRKEFHAWVHYELIRSSHHSADKALDQVLGFLECRCE